MVTVDKQNRISLPIDLALRAGFEPKGILFIYLCEDHSLNAPSRYRILLSPKQLKTQKFVAYKNFDSKFRFVIPNPVVNIFWNSSLLPVFQHGSHSFIVYIQSGKLYLEKYCE